jgi:hypothetical protein
MHASARFNPAPDWRPFLFLTEPLKFGTKLRLPDQKSLKRSKTDVPAVEELRHLPTTHDRQISAKQPPIKTRKHAMYPVFISLDEFLHGSDPPICGVERRDQV